MLADDTVRSLVSRVQFPAGSELNPTGCRRSGHTKGSGLRSRQKNFMVASNARAAASSTSSCLNSG
jgi:hypothetical protein